MINMDIEKMNYFIENFWIRVGLFGSYCFLPALKLAAVWWEELKKTLVACIFVTVGVPGKKWEKLYQHLQFLSIICCQSFSSVNTLPEMRFAAWYYYDEWSLGGESQRHVHEKSLFVPHSCSYSVVALKRNNIYYFTEDKSVKKILFQTPIPYLLSERANLTTICSFPVMLTNCWIGWRSLTMPHTSKYSGKFITL